MAKEGNTEDIAYQVYLNERNSLINCEKESSQQFDKAILALASGALGLSLAFIYKIAPNPDKSTLYLLIIAWGLFSASMLSTLISFLTSQYACRRQITILENQFSNETKNDKNILSTITAVLNFLAIFLLILGIVFLIAFSAININNREAITMSKKDDLQRGYVPPVAPKKPPVTRPNEGFIPPKPPRKPETPKK